LKQEHKFNGEGLFEIPDLWTWAISSEVCSSVRDGTHDTPKYVDNGIPLVTSKNLKNGYIDFDTAKSISIEDHEQISFRSEVKNGDILFAMIGTIGNPIVVNIDKQFSIKNIGLFKKNETVIQSIFLRYWLLSEPLNKILEVQRFISGTTQKFISLGSLRSIPIPLPPLNEQRRIVSTIEQMTDRSNKARAALEDVPKLIEQFRQSVLAAAFRGDLTADWREKNPDIEPASELLERIKIDRRKRWEEAELEKMKEQGKNPKDDKWKERYKKSQDAIVSSLVSLPDGWTWIALDELASDDPNSLAIGPFGSNLKVVDYCSEGVPLVFVREIRAETFGNLETKFVTQKKATELKSHSVSSGDLLITKMGDPPGDTAIYPDDRPPAIITADCIKLSPDKRLTSPIFLKYWLRTQYLKKIILEETQGVAQQKLSLGRFREIAIPLPPIEEQAAIVEYLEKHLQSIENIQKLANQSQIEVDILDRSILAKAFRGELVPQDPNDEPAAVLLDRIRAEREQTITPKQRGKTTRKNSSKQLSIDGIE
jgi:type I restriction enzyme, S subunit